MFAFQTEELNQEVAINVEQLQAQRREITDRRQIFQGLELELQSHLNMVNNTEYLKWGLSLVDSYMDK